MGRPTGSRRSGEPSFEVTNYDGLDRLLSRWGREPAETMICAWTPREVVRRATERAAAALDAPYVVHLEDNEEHLMAAALRLPYDEIRRLPPERQDRLAHEELIHPARYPRADRGRRGGHDDHRGAQRVQLRRTAPITSPAPASTTSASGPI